MRRAQSAFENQPAAILPALKTRALAMNRRLRKSLANHTIISLLLMSLAIRGLIPVGFMPSTGHPFTLQVCPHAGMPMVGAMSHGAADAAHREHQGRSSRAEHCPFATSASGAPTPHITQLGITPDVDVHAQLQRAAPMRAVRRLQTQQPRAPPDFV
jgi:hypothetical protein